MFRIKCINNILPTKDICYLRNPILYKSQKCIACFREDETLYHIADCEIYQKIWKNLEEETLHLTSLEALTKLDLSLEEGSLRKALYGENPEEKLHIRKMHLRGLTNKKQQADISKIARSKSKANRVLTSFIELFWSCFYKRLWKFRCEVMIEWEKQNNITTKEKKGKKIRAKRKENKENITPSNEVRESKKEKETRIQKDASSRVDRWIRSGGKEGWLRFKTN